LDSTIEEEPRKHYVAYTTARNFLCMIIQRQNIKLWLGLKPSDIPESTKGYRDVSSIGHHGTGNVEITVSTRKCFEEIKKYIAMAYNRVGG
jgi:predicted transport protein